MEEVFVSSFGVSLLSGFCSVGFHAPVTEGVKDGHVIELEVEVQVSGLA